MAAELIEQSRHVQVIEAEDEQKSIMLMDRMDLDQALAELRGEVVERFVYKVPGGWDKQNNRKAPDKRQLSYAGVREAARLYKNVHFGATAQQMPDGSWILTAFAHNHADNLQCSLPIPYPAFNPAAVQESIAYRAALSKCVRMPLAAVLPITYIEALISRWAEGQGGPGLASREQAAAPARRVETTRPAVLEAAPQESAAVEALRAQVQRLEDADPEGRARLPKSAADMTEAELNKTLAWYTRRARALTASAPQTTQAQPAAATSAPVVTAGATPDAAPLDMEMEALRLEFAELLDYFPDARADVEAKMRAAGVTEPSDAYVRAALPLLRKRAATLSAEAHEAVVDAAADDPAQQLAVDMTFAERLAQTLPMARALCERLRASGARPSPGEIDTLRTYLVEIQKCAPLADDTPVERISNATMLAALEERLLVADQAGPTPSADDDPGNVPF